MDSTGDAVAVWSQTEEIGDPEDTIQIARVWFNRFTDAGHGWGTAAPIDGSKEHADVPQVAIDSKNIMVIWEQINALPNGERRNSIFANRYTINGVGGTWGNAVVIDLDNLGHASNPQMVVDSLGNARAVWSQGSSLGVAASTSHVWTNRFVPTSWGAAAEIK
jgi:hypothetical protein